MRLSNLGRSHGLVALALATFLVSGLAAQSGGRGGGLPGYISEDLPRAIETARRTGKPLMIVFRCPP
jgi:hypothetical protein